MPSTPPIAVQLIEKFCSCSIQSMSLESWPSGDMGMEIEYTFAQNVKHITRGLRRIIFSRTRVRLVPCFLTLLASIYWAEFFPFNTGYS